MLFQESPTKEPELILLHSDLSCQLPNSSSSNSRVATETTTSAEGVATDASAYVGVASVVAKIKRYGRIAAQLLDVWADFAVCGVYYSVAEQYSQYRFFVLSLVITLVSTSTQYFASRHPRWTYPMYLLGLAPLPDHLTGRDPERGDYECAPVC